MNKADMSGIEKMRAAVRLFDNCREGALDSYSAAELMRVYEAYVHSGWDIPPDRWTLLQITMAINGIAPDWKDEFTPIHEITEKRTFAGRLPQGYHHLSPAHTWSMEDPYEVVESK